MHKIEADMIRQYIDENLFEPSCSWPRYHWDTRVYSRWAVHEILRRIETQPQVCVRVIIDAFIDDVDAYSELNNDTKFIFATARVAAQELLFLFK